MSSLFGTISIALRALLAQQGALNTTTNNIANVNTPGYTRQRPRLAGDAPFDQGSVLFGSGAVLQRVESLRDRILELRIQDEAQQQGGTDAFLKNMQQIQTAFSGSNSEIGGQIGAFFDSLQQLSVDPTSSPQRQNVLTTANNLATGFHSAAQNLARLHTNIDLSISQTVDQVNDLVTRVANLNEEVSQAQLLSQDGGAFEDQRTRVIQQLSQLISVSVLDTPEGVSLTTANGASLVAGTHSYVLSSRPDSSGVQHIFSGGQDITGNITGGQLAAQLTVRDQKIPGLLSHLDLLATNLANAFNTVHQQGYDLSGGQGGNFFAPPLTSEPGAAAVFSVLITDPAKIAASSDGTPGGNGNLAQLTAIRNQALANGQNPFDFYANLVFGIGSDVANAQAEYEAGDLVMRQLQNQRDAVSGVSLDEEAANLVRYQRAFEAAARVVTTVDEMTQTSRPWEA